MAKIVVFIRPRTVGQSFATCAQVVSQRTRRVLAESSVVPLGFDVAATAAAENICIERGYVLATLEHAS